MLRSTFYEFEEEINAFETTFDQMKHSLPSDLNSLRTQVEECLVRVHETVLQKAQEANESF